MWQSRGKAELPQHRRQVALELLYLQEGLQAVQPLFQTAVLIKNIAWLLHLCFSFLVANIQPNHFTHKDLRLYTRYLFNGVGVTLTFNRAARDP